MRILFLDDDPKRLAHFKNLYFNADVTYVTSVDEAKKAILETGKFDYMGLDHDLEGKTYVPSGPGTGYEVAQIVADLPHELRPAAVVVHSYNEKAAALMVELLLLSGIQAAHKMFGYDDFEIVWDRIMQK